MDDIPQSRLKLPGWFYWLLAILGAYLVYRSREVMLPFLISFVLAYILDPFVLIYEKRGVKRLHAVIGVFMAVFLFSVLFIIMILPPVIKQARQVERNVAAHLMEIRQEGVKEQNKQNRTESPGDGRVPPGDSESPAPSPQNPSYQVPPSCSPEPVPAPAPPAAEPSKRSAFVSEGTLFWLGLTKQFPFLKEHLGDEKEIAEMLESRQQEIGSATVKILSQVSSVALSSLSRLILVILVPLLTFYFLLVLDPLRKRILFMIPDREHREEVLSIAQEINVMLVKYLKGQIMICFLVGAAITVGAVIISLIFHTKYALLLGFITGLTSIIPYFGAIISMSFGLLIGLFTASHNCLLAAAVILIMMVCVNQLFDNIITPRIVGEQVGLHPLWTFFALLAGSQIFGFAGMLIAVPIAATIKICLLRLFPRLTAPIDEENNEEKSGEKSSAMEVPEDEGK